MKIIPHIYAIFTLFLGTFTLLCPYHAQADQKEISSREDVAIAFFKTGDVLPNFESWAKNMEAYKTVPLGETSTFIKKEKERLTKRWLNYNPQEDFIVFKVPVRITLSAVEGQKDHAKYWMRIAFADKDMSEEYFTVGFQGYYIAVIPQKSDETLIQNLRPEQFMALSERFGDSLVGTADLYIELRPAQAYTNAPHKIDNSDQWVLLSDVISMTLTDRESKPFWNYSASWYVSPKTLELNNLYKAGPQ